ncbi:unnamed protein product [Vicia faba]|uniref:Uncharacterized protein n=1 Tax=Vicia faba TaxID=3906 RepID=A0AAV0YT23_VICFA|nr:unnamed protein product [Vicia faba]
MTTTPSITLEVEQLTTVAVNFSICEPSPSHSLIKRSQGDSPSTLVEGGSPKRTCLSEGVEFEALTHFFWLISILLSGIPSTLEEFSSTVSSEDLAFV